MNGQAHALTTLAAMEALPAWERRLWAQETGNLAETYSLYGDTYAVRKQELAPFVELPDGSVPDFYMAKLRWKHHCDAAIDYWEAPFYDKALATFRHFSERIAGAIRREDIASAARFAGTMAHYIEDNACPGHAVDDTDLEIVKDLLPPPEKLRRFPFHSRMEMTPTQFSLSDYAPLLCGGSVAEASSAFVDRLVVLALEARRTILPFFRAFYESDPARSVQLNMSICRLAATVLADYLHTVTSIARARFEDHAIKALETKSLVGPHPYRQSAWAPEPYSQVAPGDLVGVNLDKAYEPVPCELRYRHGGDTRSVVVSNALGATAYYEYEFNVPAGIYEQITLDYGIHATLGAACPVTFEVYCGDRLLCRDEKRAGEPAGSAVLAWPADGDRVRLITTVAGAIDLPRVNGRPIAPTGHAVWAEPTLVKRAAAV